MHERRRADRAEFSTDELRVDVRVEGRPVLVTGRIVDASDLGFRVELSRPVVIHEGEEVVIKVRDEGAAPELGVSGMTSPCLVRRASPTELGLEAPSLSSRVRRDLADLLWERTARMAV